MLGHLAKIERFLRRYAPAVILFNVVVALLWIPAFIYGLFSPSKPEKTLQKPPELPPNLPKPEPVQVERKEEKVEREEKKVKREERPQAKVKQKEEKREERKEEKKVEVKVEEEKPPKGPFGFACRGGDCYLFDVSTGKRYRKGDTVDGWLIKDIDIHGATLVKNGKEVRVGIE